MTTTPTPRQILDLPLHGDQAAGEETIGAYLLRLLDELWAQGSNFSSKRPLGGSDWQWIIYQHLVAAGWAPGKLDEDGYLEDLERETVMVGDRLIASAIKALGAAR